MSFAYRNKEVVMNKRVFLFFMVVSVGVAFLSVGSVKSDAAPIRLTYSNFFPPTHIQSKLAEAWCDEVKKRTNGRVFVEYYAGQTLTKARQNYDGVVTGLKSFWTPRSCISIPTAQDLFTQETSQSESLKI